ncbi:virulence factor TspB C-terminal domain-related protein [Azoarcus olearius]|uniref:virulence factor TspB C-terminal domain-related protein n=1 Tax=Azoarcus sp. (strain BH72) TaxID=418699 RepID=UPI0014722006|nr:virulence factor TspB C-terminal domain-related protein [Azoarcus olearius]
MTAGKIAKGAVGVAKALGPGVVSAIVIDLVWDEVSKRWLVPQEADADKKYDLAFTGVGTISETDKYQRALRDYTVARLTGTVISVDNVNEQTATITAMVSGPGPTLYSSLNGVNYTWTSQVSGPTPAGAFCGARTSGSAPAPSCSVTAVFTRSPDPYTISVGVGTNWSSGDLSCPAGYIRSQGTCIPETRTATDSEIETSIRDGLLSTPQGAPDVARRTWDGGGVIEETAPVASGPASVPGPSTTTTNSSPSGVTTVVNNTTYNITYSQNTVTITQTDTQTKTNPDGSTETTTTTTAPAPGQVPAEPEEEKNPCEENPDASACEELGDPQDDAELGSDEREVSWSQEGGASGSCPSPKTFSHAGQTFTLTWDPVCQLATSMRPIVLILASLGALLFIFYVSGKAS